MTAKVLDGEAVAARDPRRGRGACAPATERGHRSRARDDPRRRRRPERAVCRAQARGLCRGRASTRSTSTSRPTSRRPISHEVIVGFNDDPAVHSILLQLPLPPGLDEERALLLIDPAKDVDGIHPVNLGRLVMGRPGPLSCTPAGIVELLTAYGVPIEGRHAW